MTQYCRYCNNANLIGDDIFYCQPKNEVYGIEKSKRVNKCKLFDFNENDLWRCDENGNFETYKPRQKKFDKGKPLEQYDFFMHPNDDFECIVSK